jgi:hypothetical protein
MWPLLVPIRDAPSAEVVRGEFDLNPVAGQDADVVHPHLAADVCKHTVPVVEFDSEHCAWKRFYNLPFQDDHVIFRFRQCISPRG